MKGRNGRWISTGTVKQLLFATSLFCDLTKKNWFAAINFHDLNVDFRKNKTAKIFEDWFAVRNIQDDKAFTNLAKNSRTKFSHTNKSWFTVCM